MPEVESWLEYKRLVISKLEDLAVGQENLFNKLIAIDKRLIIVETKAAVLGGIAGFAGFIIPKLIEKFL